MKTMKWLTNTLKASLVSILFIFSVNTQAGIIFELSSNDIVVGDTFFVDIILDNTNAKELRSFAFDVNDSALQHVNYLGDTLLNPDFDSFLFGLDVDKFVISPVGIDDAEILLASLSFTAHTAGSEVLTILGNDGLFSGVFLSDFSYEEVDSGVVLNVREVPEPATLAMMFLGLFVCSRRVNNKA